jgi:hypothetical protein
MATKGGAGYNLSVIRNTEIHSLGLREFMSIQARRRPTWLYQCAVRK